MSCINQKSEQMWKSMVAGALGGLVASWAMNQFQSVVSEVSEAVAKRERERLGLPESPAEQSSDEDATVKAARAISTTVFDHELTADETEWAGPAMHYGLGTTLGVVYGALAVCTPSVERGAGTAYGSAVWLGADEVAVPLAGLSGPPSETPLSGHVKALASHLVFGLVTHLTRKLALS